MSDATPEDIFIRDRTLKPGEARMMDVILSTILDDGLQTSMNVGCSRATGGQVHSHLSAKSCARVMS